MYCKYSNMISSRVCLKQVISHQTTRLFQTPPRCCPSWAARQHLSEHTPWRLFFQSWLAGNSPNWTGIYLSIYIFIDRCVYIYNIHICIYVYTNLSIYDNIIKLNGGFSSEACLIADGYVDILYDWLYDIVLQDGDFGGKYSVWQWCININININIDI